MSRIDELIAEHCPNGVEYKTLGELGYFYGGLTGKSKDDFKDGNAKFITYMNVFSNLEVNIKMPDRVKIGVTERQNTVNFGDVLFTGSSETRDECGMTAVLTDKTNEPLFLNSFCFGFRLNDTSLLLPSFSKYLFRSETLRKQIIRTASGVTRFNVSKEKMKKVCIPLPPLPVQRKIVEILDNFTELTAELTARKKQYEYYRDMLLVCEGAPIVSLGDIADVTSGGTPQKGKHEYWSNGTIKWLGSTVCKGKKSVDEITDYITEQGLKNSSARLLKKGTTLIAMVGATIGKVAYLSFEATTNQNIAALYPLDVKTVNPSYLFYACQNLYQQFVSFANGKLSIANLTFIKKLQISLPPLAEQSRIVEILDKFDALTTDITAGLPAEIAVRQRQYEYYRDKLLTFKEIS